MITITTVDGLAASDCLAIVQRLTRPASEFQIEVAARRDGRISSATPIALWHDRGTLLAWACSHVWRDYQTLEMFTDARHRGRGIALALSATLLAGGVLDQRRPLAVFAPSTAAIARRLGFAVERFEHDWRPSE